MMSMVCENKNGINVLGNEEEGGVSENDLLINDLEQFSNLCQGNTQAETALVDFYHRSCT